MVAVAGQRGHDLRGGRGGPLPAIPGAHPERRQILVQLRGVTATQAVADLRPAPRLHFAVPVAGTPTVNGRPGHCTTGTCVDQPELVPSGCWPAAHTKKSCQFNNTLYYPVDATTGQRYHWRIVPSLTASDITAATVRSSPGGGYAVNIAFNRQGAAAWSKLTTAACAKNPGCRPTGGTTTSAPPTAQLAIFLGSQVLIAPVVSSPSRYQTQITGNFTYASAAQIVDDIKASRAASRL
jgi:preprotein translocase subunit SecD